MISCGILIYRFKSDLEVFLIHPGGPIWKNRDLGSWSIPKGLNEHGEDLIDSAFREFNEETGFNINFNRENLIDLGSVNLKYKEIRIYAVEYDLGDNLKIKSNTFKLEWPPKSKNINEYPETDNGMYFKLSGAYLKINKNQVEFLDRLKKHLKV